ncbi:pumilio 12 [Actinidia rufa]|uniref:Pumilio 12 n=1 Tax=Actinidia rufa TaxID=165716 RepID=A0A7J0H4X4_9ERIC|nr:pumilio 12 [Actinidia rufa]
MEKGINELEVDEFEKLLGEIPNVTSGAPNTEESGRIDFSKDLKRVSMDESLTFPSNGTVSEKLENDGSLDTVKLSVIKIPQPHIQSVQEEEPNLPDDQSLTSAFAELSFNERATIGAARSPFVDFKSFQNHSIMFNGTYPNGVTKLTSNVDSQAMFVPTFQSLNNSSNSFEMFGAKNGFQESSNPFRPNVQEFKKKPVGYRQPIENFSDSYLFTHGVPGYQFFSNMPIQGVELPVFSDQRQYFMDTQSQLPYLHSQLSQPHVTWRPMEEEQFYRMHKQYLYMQQLRNQRLEAQQPIRSNGNVVARIMSQNLLQPMNIHLSNHVLSSTDFNKTQVLDKVGKQTYPEKILMKSQGLNSLRSVKFGSLVGNELLADVNQSGRVFSNGHYHQSLPDSNAAFHLDSVSSRGPTWVPLLAEEIYRGYPEDVEKIFLEIIVHIIELMTDPFGNYLVQKLLEVCNEAQRMQILRVITRKCGDLVRISCDTHGTRAVQKIIETLKTPEQFSMVVSSLKPGIVTVTKNMNGNHVAQRCLQYLLPEYCEFLFEAAIGNCVELATDRHGCCVLQKCLDRSDGEHRHLLISEITSNALILSQDQFGNYVVQFIFEIHVPWATVDILDQLEGNYGDLSMQKYSSNVVEKCLKYAGEERRSCIIQELINNPRLDQIMQDPYGNYVIQAALNHSKIAVTQLVLDVVCLKTCLGRLRQHEHWGIAAKSLIR